MKFNPMGCYRVSHWLYERNLRFPARLMDQISLLIFRCQIPCTAKIGPGTEVGHSGIGVVVHHRATIGSNVFISHGVTIGGRNQAYEVPRIENNVYVGVGASVLGDVMVGEGAVIGAHALVTRSVPPRTIVAGMPARVIRENIDVYDYTGWPPKDCVIDQVRDISTLAEEKQ